MLLATSAPKVLTKSWYALQATTSQQLEAAVALPAKSASTVLLAEQRAIPQLRPPAQQDTSAPPQA